MKQIGFCTEQSFLSKGGDTRMTIQNQTEVQWRSWGDLKQRSFLLTSKSSLWNQALGWRAQPMTLHMVTWVCYLYTHGGAQTSWSWTRVKIWKSHKLVSQSLNIAAHKNQCFSELGLHTTDISITVGACLKCYFLVPTAYPENQNLLVWGSKS